jgi:hypothetical protein
MAQTTDYSSLKANVADWLNRSDLTSAIPVFIQNAESSLKRDHRVRKLQTRTLTASADDTAVPSDYGANEAMYHDGSTYYHGIEVVGAERLGELKQLFGTTGPPAYAALLDGVIRWAPVPDTTYTLKWAYWRKLLSLSDSQTTNWLIEEHPDIYLYAALLESAPYLKGDERLAVWGSELERRLEELHRDTERQHFSGPMSRRVRVLGK